MSTIGERLRKERERLELTQEAFAEYGGVKKRAQITYEQDARSPDAGYLAGLASIGVDVLYVITGVRTPPGAAGMQPDESALLDNYRNASEDGRSAARRVLDALAESEVGKRKAS
ncbi:helix-turn-helix transcriptional regulator [Pigmentiphaga sp. CHJ604]|uniref:helix-turn-helix domain-containing protein n=1 Tax=Pigmentiphaga sp. CHJ604 TaxID=3081984 RepID=UPI0030D0BD74